jgi:hypothetical protein
VMGVRFIVFPAVEPTSPSESAPPERI